MISGECGITSRISWAPTHQLHACIMSMLTLNLFTQYNWVGGTFMLQLAKKTQNYPYPSLPASLSSPAGAYFPRSSSPYNSQTKRRTASKLSEIAKHPIYFILGKRKKYWTFDDFWGADSLKIQLWHIIEHNRKCNTNIHVIVNYKMYDIISIKWYFPGKFLITANIMF